MTPRTWDFSFRHLRTLLAVVECGGVSKAAAQLHVTQPAVSKLIRGMERTLGSELFRKRGRQLELTPVGEMFVRRARGALAEFKAGALEYEALRENEVELVRVFGAPSVMPVLVPRAIARLHRQRPHVQVILSGEAYYGSSYVAEAVANGDVDMGITLFSDDQRIGTLKAEPLFEARLSVVARSDHRLAGVIGVGMVDLMDELIVLPPLEAIAGRIMVQEFSAVGLSFPPRRMIAANRQVTTGLIRECNAVAFMTHHPACGDLDTPELTRLDVNFRQPRPWKLSVCRRALASPSPALAAFERCLRELVAEAEARDPPSPAALESAGEATDRVAETR